MTTKRRQVAVHDDPTTGERCAGSGTKPTGQPVEARIRSLGKTLYAVIFTVIAGGLGILGYFNIGPGGESGGSGKPSSAVNTNYLADLVETGPFEEPLPHPFTFHELRMADIADEGTASKLTAVEVGLDVVPQSRGFGLATYAHLEVYRSEDDTTRRWQASLEDLGSRYGQTPVTAGADEATEYCVWGEQFWTCAAHHRYIYVEVTVSPGSNAELSLTREVVTALLRYGDRMTRLAAND